MSQKPIIRIIDVTNRDGVQTSRICLAKLQKTMINKYLNDIGAHQSEFGFPFTNHEINYLNANLELQKKGFLDKIILEGWCTVRMSEAQKSFKLVKGLKDMNISVSTSEQMIKGKWGGRKTEDDVLAMMVEVLEYCRAQGATVGFNAEDASRTDMKFLKKFAQAGKDHGGVRFRYCDTLGYDSPMSIYARVAEIVKEVGLPVEIHAHNDLGLVIATSCAGAIAAIDNGVDAYINTCVNGMGERAGNADLVSVLLALRKASGWRERELLDPKVDLSYAWKIAKYASYAFDVPIPINQPGVGANAFAHESGIHADGALKDRRNYELYDFEELGRGEPEIIETGRQITVGEYGGIKGFRNVYDKLEVEFKSEAEATEILELVRYANVHTQKPLLDVELKFIAQYPEEARKMMTVKPL